MSIRRTDILDKLTMDEIEIVGISGTAVLRFTDELLVNDGVAVFIGEKGPPGLPGIQGPPGVDGTTDPRIDVYSSFPLLANTATLPEIAQSINALIELLAERDTFFTIVTPIPLLTLLSTSYTRLSLQWEPTLQSFFDLQLYENNVLQGIYDTSGAVDLSGYTPGSEVAFYGVYVTGSSGETLVVSLDPIPLTDFVAAVTGSTRIQVLWNNRLDPEITTVRLTKDAEQQVLPVADLSASLLGLSPNTTYLIRVQYQVEGFTGQDLAQSVTTDPIPLTGFTVSATPTTIQVSWNPAPSDEITGVRLTVEGVPQDVSAGSTSTLLTGLVPNTDYSIRVQYLIDSFAGTDIAQTIMTESIPATNFTLVGQGTSVVVSWDPAPPNKDIIAVRVTFDGSSNDLSAATTSTTYTDLSTGVIYTVSVRFVVSGGYVGTDANQTITLTPPPTLFGPLQDGKSIFTDTVIYPIEFGSNTPSIQGFRVPSGSSYTGYSFNRVIFPNTLISFNPYGDGNMRVRIFSGVPDLSNNSNQLAVSAIQTIINRSFIPGFAWPDTYVFDISAVSMAANTYIAFESTSGGEVRFAMYRSLAGDPLIGIQNVPDNWDTFQDSTLGGSGYAPLCNFELV